MTTGVVVQSGRFTASPIQLQRVLDAHKDTLDAAVEDDDSKVILLTEMSPNKYDNELVDWADDFGWHLYHPTTSGPDECAILSSRPIRHQFYFLLTHLRLDPKVTNRTAPLFVTAAQVDRDGWFGVWHSPAHNEGLRPGNAATRVYRSALGGLKTWRMRLNGQVAIGGDWNADLRRDKIRAVLTRRFPLMHFAGAAASAPTEGGRVIDGLMTTRRVVRKAETLRGHDGFDHRGVLVVLH